jgi:uncharacterized phiE125 gp8 family phage protein
MQLITQPIAEPIDLDQAKTQCRVDGGADDQYISTLISVAREHVETVTQLQLLTQTWDVSYAAWPGQKPWGSQPLEMRINRWPLQSVTWIKWRDTGEVEHTLDPATYLLALGQRPARVVVRYGQSWPSDALSPADPITIRCVAGYTRADDVPQVIKAAMLLLIGHLYENREAVMIGAGLTATQLPMGFDELLATHRGYRMR